jgi:hypothetical protein
LSARDPNVDEEVLPGSRDYATTSTWELKK